FLEPALRNCAFNQEDETRGNPSLPQVRGKSQRDEVIRATVSLRGQRRATRWEKATDFHCKCKPRCGVLSPLLAMTASRVSQLRSGGKAPASWRSPNAGTAEGTSD